ncbi:MAG: glycosyltransferase [Candidatus Obscuribacterales bacterium]|nr:glycosyltransferase [Candidatus Obscuribacterales bacterium]
MTNVPRHLVMIAPTANIECDSRVIHMINAFCDEGSKVSIVCPPQRGPSEDLAGLLHESATMCDVPFNLPEGECYDLTEYLGGSINSRMRQWRSQLVRAGVRREFDEPIGKLPMHLRKPFLGAADKLFEHILKRRKEAAENQRYWQHFLSYQLPPALYRKYESLIQLDCYNYFYFIKTLMLNKFVEPVDAVYCNDLWSLPAGCLIKELLAITLFYDSHEIGTATISDPVNSALAAQNEKWMYRLCDSFITVNDSCAEYYMKLCSFLEPVVIPNAHRFPVIYPPDALKLKQRLGLAADSHLAVYVGSLSPFSHLDRFIEAISHSTSNLHFAIVGADGELEQLKALATDLKLLDKKVFFLGRCNFQEVLSLIYGADFGIIPNIQKHANPWIISSSKLFDYVQAEMPFISDLGPEIQKILDAYPVGKAVDFQTNPASIAGLLDEFTRQVVSKQFSKVDLRKAKHDLTWSDNAIHSICAPRQVFQA